ncbi:zinc finger protein 510-like [Betta splendens]|uniref:Zinc finger protein 510-like n=1 Tax=Betta splendens TaxID=158456 RepID=A0A6P7L1P5_BETSP|nr:zinc finger protein 510-like [Betta splendens]
MSSVQHLKEFISQRLAAAAVEIFGAFEQTIVEYEEELDRQRRLLDAVLKPEIKLHRIETPEIPDVFEEEEAPTHLQICHHIMETSQNENYPIPLQIKEEHEEPRTSEEQETLVLKQETDNVMSSAYEDNQLLSHSFVVTLDVNNSMSKTHTDEKTFICPTCGRTFKGKGALQMHVKTHVKQHLVCNTCGKKFLYLSVFKIHERIHTGEKPFPCKTCGKRYKQKAHLEVHLRIHTGEKPFPCRTCGKRFRQKPNLKAHLMRNHMDAKDVGKH